MPGLDPGIHEAVHQARLYCSYLPNIIMDRRVKPGDDAVGVVGVTIAKSLL
jgi:hypothetical protein